MKETITTIIIFIFCIYSPIIYAQDIGQQKNTSNNILEKVSKTFIYDVNKQNWTFEKEYAEKDDDGNLKMSSEVYFSYNYNYFKYDVNDIRRDIIASVECISNGDNLVQFINDDHYIVYPSRAYYTYNNFGLLQKKELYHRNLDSKESEYTWFLVYEKEYNYEIDSKGSTTTEYTYSIDDGIKILTSKQIRYYNSNNTLLNSVSESYNNNDDYSSITYTKVEYTYINNLLRKEITNTKESTKYSSDSDWNLGEYRISNETIYSYSNSQKVTKKEKLYYNCYYCGSLELQSRRESFFDSSELLTLNISYRIRDNIEEITYKTEYNYDGKGNRINNITYHPEGDDWLESRMTKYVIDYKTLISDVNIPPKNAPELSYPQRWIGFRKLYYEGIFTNFVLEIGSYTWDSSNDDWVISSKSLFGLDESLSSNEEEIMDVKVFPNPTNRYLSIDTPHDLSGSRIIIYNSNGARVLEEVLYMNNTIDLFKLNSGIYFYKLFLEHIIIEGKVVKN